MQGSTGRTTLVEGELEKEEKGEERRRRSEWGGRRVERKTSEEEEGEKGTRVINRKEMRKKRNKEREREERNRIIMQGWQSRRTCEQPSPIQETGRVLAWTSGGSQCLVSVS